MSTSRKVDAFGGFYSKLVRLKGNFWIYAFAFVFRFYSKLVRLKVRSAMGYLHQ